MQRLGRVDRQRTMRPLIEAARAWLGLPSGSGATSVALFARTGLQALTFIVIARALGTADYGLFVALVALALLCAPFASGGYEFITLRSVAVGRLSVSQALGNGLLVIGCIGPPLLAAVWVICNTIAGIDASVRTLACVLISDLLLAPAMELVWRAFQASGMLGTAASLRALQAAVRCLGALLFSGFAASRTLDTWAMIYALGNLVTLAVAVVLAFQRFGRPTTARGEILPGLADGGFFAFNSATERATNDIDKIMLASQASYQVAGAYSAAYRFVELALVPIAAALTAESATAFRAGADGLPQARLLARRLLAPLALYSAVTAAVLLIAAPVVPYVLGAAYRESASVVQALALFPLLHACRHCLTLVLAGLGAQRFVTAVQVGGAFASGALNFCLIPGFGWAGAVYATLSVEAAIAVVFAWRLARGS